jgi:hypothetical protein
MQMAEDPMQENPLLEKLIAQGADTATVLRGYVGPSAREGYVRLYPRLGNLSESMEVPQADILHSIKEPRSVFGSIVLWVKKDANIIFHRVETPGGATSAGPQANTIEVRQGRLRMRIRKRAGSDPRDTCVSICSCGVCVCLCLMLPAWAQSE